MTPTERAARAISVAAHDHNGLAEPWWSEDGEQPGDTVPVTEEDKALYRQQALAAFAAIREPTEAMADKGGASIAGQFTDPWDVLSPQEEEALGLEVDGDDAYLSANERLAPYASEAWQAMIDAAIAES